MSWFICPQSLVAVFKGIRALFIIVMDDGSLPFCDLSLTHALYLSLLLSDLPSVTCVARLTTSLEIVDITFPRGKRGGHEKKKKQFVSEMIIHPGSEYSPLWSLFSHDWLLTRTDEGF